MPETVPQRAPTLYLIITFKLLKGLMLVGLAFGLHRIAGDDLAGGFERLLRWLHLDPERRFFTDMAQQIAAITPDNLRWVVRGTLLYSLFSLVEGIGLIFRVKWAGWLAIGESAFFIPIELYELGHTFSLTLMGILIVNLCIVLYLYHNRERLFAHH